MSLGSEKRSIGNENSWYDGRVKMRRQREEIKDKWMWGKSSGENKDRVVEKGESREDVLCYSESIWDTFVWEGGYEALDNEASDGGVSNKVKESIADLVRLSFPPDLEVWDFTVQRDRLRPIVAKIEECRKRSSKFVALLDPFDEEEENIRKECRDREEEVVRDMEREEAKREDIRRRERERVVEEKKRLDGEKEEHKIRIRVENKRCKISDYWDKYMWVDEDAIEMKRREFKEAMEDLYWYSPSYTRTQTTMLSSVEKLCSLDSTKDRIEYCKSLANWRLKVLMTGIGASSRPKPNYFVATISTIHRPFPDQNHTKHVSPPSLFKKVSLNPNVASFVPKGGVILSPIRVLGEGMMVEGAPLPRSHLFGRSMENNLGVKLMSMLGYVPFNNNVDLFFPEAERYMSGIGSKLMRLMGYQGDRQGLGRFNQGDYYPIKVIRRPRRMGLGAYYGDERQVSDVISDVANALGDTSAFSAVFGSSETGNLYYYGEEEEKENSNTIQVSNMRQQKLMLENLLNIEDQVDGIVSDKVGKRVEGCYRGEHEYRKWRKVKERIVGFLLLMYENCLSVG